MKRTKSVLSIRSLPIPHKHSLQLYTAVPQAMASVQSVTVLSRMRLSAQPSRQLTLDQRDNRVFVVEKQIAAIERQLKDVPEGRPCENDLSLYDQLAKQCAESEAAVAQARAAAQLARERLLMLREEGDSLQFNLAERIAEKEYHEELVDAYAHQYPAESALVLAAIGFQRDSAQLREEISAVSVAIERAREQLQRWKEERGFELNDHRLRNNVRAVRMRLIEKEEHCDTHCAAHGLRKVRELSCLFFKDYAKANGIAPDQAHQDGIEVFLCRQGIVDEFGEFVREHLVFGKPVFPALESYLGVLGEMEVVFRRSAFEGQRKAHSVLESQVRRLEEERRQKEKAVTEKEGRVRALRQQVEELFGSESIAVIEYLRQKNRNRYDLTQIKATLREHKKEQHSRIARVNDSLTRTAHLERVLQRHAHTQLNQEPIHDLNEQITQAKLRQEELELRLKRQRQEKAAVEDRISAEITRWRKDDQKRERLKALYQQLEAAQQGQDYRITKNQQTEDEKADCPLKIQPRTHSRTASVSLSQSKSALSLGNPFKKALEKSVKESKESGYQPILADCKLILSRKLTTRKQLSVHDLESSLKPKASQMARKKTAGEGQCSNKENVLWNAKSKSGTMTPLKQSLAPTAHSRQACLTHRGSLSRLLISKLNR